MRAVSFVLLSLALLDMTLAAPLEGRVLDPQGDPVAQVLVEIAAGDKQAWTDPRGRFEIDQVEFPVDLLVSHPAYAAVRLKVSASDPLPLEISFSETRLTQEVLVTAEAPDTRFSPLSGSAGATRPEQLPIPAGSTADLIAHVPGAARNGQGGLFQTYSIRGIGGQRVQTSLQGARLTSERRAGVSASFFDPFLLGAAETLRGPGSTLYGSGALGGVINLKARRFQGERLRLEFDSQGQQSLLGAGWGAGNTSAGAAVRRSDRTTAPDGQAINSHFKTASASFFHHWGEDERQLQLLLVPSFSWDIGKANTDFPERTTIYPEEKHLLANLRALLPVGQLDAFVHPHDLQTRTLEEEAATDVFNDTVDFGIRFGRQAGIGSRGVTWLEIDYFGRRSVDAVEERECGRQQPVEGGVEDEVGLAASLHFDLSSIILESGVRLDLFRQGTAVSQAENDTAWNGFGGIVFPLREDLRLRATLGSGARFPTLSERFFSGTTGRGEIIGNRNLSPERSFNLEGGLEWETTASYTQISLFRNRIKNYIERIEVDPDLFTFVNLVEGTIVGLEWESGVKPADGWNLYMRGHLMDGEDGKGEPLSDIPMHETALGFRWTNGLWESHLEWMARGAKKDPGSGEKRVSGAYPLQAGLSRRLDSGFRLFFAVRNLFDESYFVTADRKSPFSAGRSLGLGLIWSSD